MRQTDALTVKICLALTDVPLRPDVAASLFTEVAASPEQGTHDNPIPYNGNMELVEGLYYSQDGVTYLCTRSTGVPVYNALRDLVNLYVVVA